MSAVDFRRLLEVGVDQRVSIGVIVEQPTDPRPITLEVSLGGLQLGMALDYSEAGELFDTLASAMGVVITGQATAKVHRVTFVRDTPTEGSDSPAVGGV